MPSTAPAATIVIFGARGDLTKRLLMPALYNLVAEGLLDKQTRIVGLDHGDISKDTWVATLTQMLQQTAADAPADFPHGVNAEYWSWITDRAHYLRGEFDEEITYANLTELLASIATETGTESALFYIATAPRFFARVVTGLGEGKLLDESDNAFRRVVVEKPFGRDQCSAQALNDDLLKQGKEDQFYRIDHFLGKEPVRGILSWRFANRLFEPVWNSRHIDHVQITAAETVGVETRGPFYEATGALRDMIPSHLFSVMSMIAMEQPVSLASEDVRNAQVDVLKSIAPIATSDAVRGQYAAGEVRGKKIVAYRESDRVDRASRIETYAALRLHIDMPRWHGVPFFIRTGKALAARQTCVAVTFKPQATLQFAGETQQANVIQFNLNGNTGITTHILGKKPGPQEKLASIPSNLDYDATFGRRAAIGYETLVYDCLHGRQTLFLREDAIDTAWKAVEAVLQAWGANGEPQLYSAGSSGPTDSDALLAASGRKWLPLNGAVNGR